MAKVGEQSISAQAFYGGSERSSSKDQTVRETFQFLHHVPLFQRLPEKAFQDLIACVEPMTFQKGQVIIKEGDVGEDFFVIKTGKATVSVDGKNVADLESYDYFGESALLQHAPRTATITANESTEALKITRSRFQQYRLHEKLDIPTKKKDKLTKRHKMMAAGTSGATQKNNDNNTIVRGSNMPGNMRGSNLPGNIPTNARSSNLPRRASAEWMQSASPEGEGSMSTKQGEGFWSTQFYALKDIFSDRVNVTAFVFVPLGQYVKYAEYSSGIVFTANFCAIVPLASILGQATEALANHTGQLIGGLLNATFGNAVEMIMCIQAVRAGLISVVQGNLLGSILSNLLLVLGMAIIASGLARKNQDFNAQGAAANMSCQLVASISICLPTVYASMRGHTFEDTLQVSRICSFFLVTVYCMFLYFMLKTHHELFADEDEEEGDEDALSPSLSVLLLMLCTLVVFFCSECLVDSIDEVSKTYGLSKSFIGVILLPIVGNAAEHATAVTCAYKGMMDLALGVAVGSSTQIALFVVPCAVVAGYFYDSPMNLNFTIFDATCQMLTVFLVSQVLQHGQTQWLHGVMLMAVYIFIAIINLYSD